MTDQLRLDRIESRVDRHDHLLRGNGEPGLTAIVRENTKQLMQLDERIDGVVTGQAELKESIDSLRDERREDHAKATGRRELYNAIKFTIGLATAVIGLWLAVTQLQLSFSAIQQQLNSLPPLPE